MIHGLYWLTANLAGEGPVLAWVDDLQWVDSPSLQFLAYLSRRLTGLSRDAAVRPATGAARRRPHAGRRDRLCPGHAAGRAGAAECRGGDDPGRGPARHGARSGFRRGAPARDRRQRAAGGRGAEGAGSDGGRRRRHHRLRAGRQGREAAFRRPTRRPVAPERRPPPARARISQPSSRARGGCRS